MGRYLTRRPELLVLTLVSACLAAAWAVVVPTFEAPDEPAHWDYVTFLAREGSLPAESALSAEDGEPPGYESHQPPLFYVSAAALLRFAPGLDEEVELPRNPRFRTATDEPHLFVHPPLGDARAGVLAVRLLSAVYGMGTVVLAYLLAALVFDGRRPEAFAAAALVGLSPQFLFISGSVNNDALAALLSTATLLTLLRLHQTRDARWWLPAALGAALGAACLAKLAALSLLPLVGGLVLWRFARVERRPLHLAAFALALVAVAGWYFGRNALLLGDPLLTDLAEGNTPKLIDRKGLASPYWHEVFVGRLFETFWGYFGWRSIRLPSLVYRGLLVALLLAVAGVVVLAWRARRGDGPRRQRALRLGLLALAVGGNFAGVVHYNLTYSQAQGRFLFPSIAAIAVLLVAGWSTLLSPLVAAAPRPALARALPRLACGAVAVGLAALNFYALRLVYDAYWSTPL